MTGTVPDNKLLASVKQQIKEYKFKGSEQIIRKLINDIPEYDISATVLPNISTTSGNILERLNNCLQNLEKINEQNFKEIHLWQLLQVILDVYKDITQIKNG